MKETGESSVHLYLYVRLNAHGLEENMKTLAELKAIREKMQTTLMQVIILFQGCLIPKNGEPGRTVMK